MGQSLFALTPKVRSRSGKKHFRLKDSRIEILRLIGDSYMFWQAWSFSVVYYSRCRAQAALWMCLGLKAGSFKG
jgi:hypothetical protein